MDFVEEKVSVIVPIYNMEKYLERCVDSLLKQTYKNLEIILVDDGSTDKSASICDEYAQKDERVVVIHKENGGVSSARNAALDIFKGEYIVFVDPDDYVCDNYVQYLFCLLKSNECRICSCGHFRITAENQEIKTDDLAAESIKKIAVKDYRLGQVSVWGVMIHRSVLKKECGDVRFDERYDRTEDILFLAELIANLTDEEIYVESTKKLYYYTFYRQDSLVHVKNKEKIVSSYSHLYEDFKNKCGNRKTLFKSCFQWMAFNYVFMINAFVDNGCFEGEYYKKAKKIIRRRFFNILFSDASFFYKKRLFVMVISPKLYGKLKSKR